MKVNMRDLLRSELNISELNHQTWYFIHLKKQLLLPRIDSPLLGPFHTFQGKPPMAKTKGPKHHQSCQASA